MSNRVIRVQLKHHREEVEVSLKLAIRHPKFEDKFLAQALKHEKMVAKLESKLY